MSVVPGWVGEKNIGIPAEGFFLVVFTSVGYVGLCGVLHVALSRLSAGKDPVSASDPLPRKIFRSHQFWFRFLFVILAAGVGGSQIVRTCGDSSLDSYCENWHLLYWYSLLLIVTANISLRPHEFYLGEGISLADTLKFYFLSRPLPTAEDIYQRVQAKYCPDEQISDGQAQNEGVGFWTLMPSVFITWIFAKYVRNAAVLGARFGMLGGLAYDSWYLSFFSSAIVCYFLRTRYGFRSLPTAVLKNYGAPGAFCLMLCVLFRLFNEVWSNATVIGLIYGPAGSEKYWGACWFSVLVPAIYVVMGGMRSSLFSDVFQAALAIVFLVVVLGTIATDKEFSDTTDAFTYAPKSVHGFADGGWEPGWWAYTIAGSVSGVISYPWLDPVLTDRAFLGTPKTMLKSFFVGGLISMLFVFFFATIGVYGAWLNEKYAADCGCSGGVAVNATATCPSHWNPCSHLMGTLGEASDVAWILGHRTYRGAEMFITLVMITASLSSLDSTLTSCAKLVSLEFGGLLQLKGDKRGVMAPLRPSDILHIGSDHLSVGRVGIIAMAFIGAAFLGYEKDAMKATTVAGMSIMGIGAPIWWMTIWRTKREGRKGWRQAPLAFVVPFAVGCFVGVSYYLQGEANTDRVAWCTAEGLGGDCVTKEQGWTYRLSIGTYTGDAGQEVQNAYGRYLGTMLAGHGAVIVLFFIFFALHQLIPLTPEVTPEKVKAELIEKEETKEDIEKTVKIVTMVKV